VNWSLVIGHWSLVTGYLSLVIGHWIVACGLWLMACGLWLAACGLLYFLLIGVFTYGWFRRKKSISENRYSIFEIHQSIISVVVAARNEEIHILNLLEDLLLQDYPAELLEIIVVDDHSMDNTSRIVREFIQKHKIPRSILLKNSDDKSSGKKAALDFGINHSTGEIIITTDADCRVGPGWVSSLTAGFRDEKIKMAFGPVAYITGNNLSDKFQSLEFLGLVASGAGAAMAGHPFLCNGANLAYRKSAFQQVKGFRGNEGFISGDDVFLLHKMKKEFGRKSVIFNDDEKSIVKTYPAPGLRKFISQRVRWASKSKGYKDGLSILTAIVVFSYSFTILSSFITGFFNPFFFLAFGGLLLIKMIADFPLMMGITGFTGQRGLMRWYLPFQVVYPAYIVIAGLGSFLGRKRW
jgi:cellulose synthase/poly-beta-1,6-N-acetylglucosamine synthase-like glycosyltransferase